CSFPVTQSSTIFSLPCCYRYYEESNVPLRERTITCRVYTSLSDLERLVVTNDGKFSQGKPLSTIQTASVLRKLIGEDLSSKQRNSINIQTIEKYARTTSAPCQMVCVLLLIRMPLSLFTLIATVITKFNEG
ncbi:hypothetical protein PFISCL1PPCAC_7532, partial [Pristionchus fissidentatus]